MPVLTNGVCAVIVTFNPQRQDLEHMSAVRSQVDGLVIVDNGSTPEELEFLRISSSKEPFTLIENGENLGIAAALNVGVRWAKSNGFEWVVLLDQDSTVAEKFIEHMLSDFNQEAEERNLLQIVPRYRDPETGEERKYPLHKDGGPLLTITSGSMFPAYAFDRCGYFQESLFVYCVDDEFSLRIRSLGYSISESKNAVLFHQSGTPSRHRFLGKSFTTNNYRPTSRYYFFRNKVWMLRTYGARYPELLLPSLKEFVVIPMKIILAEENAWSKVKMSLRGLLDGILGKTGKLYLTP
jgi:rhamnosyltransferase